MSRISKYQENLKKFIDTKSFITKCSPTTATLLSKLINNTDNLMGITSLTLLNNFCKKNDIRIHGYYLAGAIIALTCMARVCDTIDRYYDEYGKDVIDKMINEVVCWVYWSVIQNIETLNLTTQSDTNEIISKSMEACSKTIPLIIMRQEVISDLRMKHTDIYRYGLDTDMLNMYKSKNRIESNKLMDMIKTRYGTVASLTLILSNIFGKNEMAYNDMINIGKNIGVYLKIVEDFISIKTDLETKYNTTNYIINCGIKEAYIEMMEAKTAFIEEMIKLDIESRTINEIVVTCTELVDGVMEGISVDMNSHYDECSV